MSEQERGPGQAPELVIEDSEAAQRAQALASEAPVERPASVPGAVIGGLIGALIGAGAWWALIRATGMELGLVAIGVGLLAGFGVVKGGGRGQTQQIIGALCGLVGIVLGRVLFYYFGFDDEMVKELLKQQPGMSAEDARLAIQMAKDQGAISLTFFLKESTQALDILFFGIGMFEGWRIPRAQ